MSSNLTMHYSHAAPFIREQLCRAAHRWTNAPTKREEASAKGEFDAYAMALGVLVAAGDYRDVAGIGNERFLPEQAIAVARDQLGAPEADRLGIVQSPGIVP